jgi:hypothetical protein
MQTLIDQLKEGQCSCHLEPNPVCQNRNDRGFVCTELPGHVGPHIACGVFTHSIESWPNEQAAELTAKAAAIRMNVKPE